MSVVRNTAATEAPKGRSRRWNQFFSRGAIAAMVLTTLAGCLEEAPFKAEYQLFGLRMMELALSSVGLLTITNVSNENIVITEILVNGQIPLSGFGSEPLMPGQSLTFDYDPIFAPQPTFLKITSDRWAGEFELSKSDALSGLDRETAADFSRSQGRDRKENTIKFLERSAAAFAVKGGVQIPSQDATATNSGKISRAPRSDPSPTPSSPSAVDARQSDSNQNTLSSAAIVQPAPTAPDPTPTPPPVATKFEGTYIIHQSAESGPLLLTIGFMIEEKPGEYSIGGKLKLGSSEYNVTGFYWPEANQLVVGRGPHYPSWRGWLSGDTIKGGIYDSNGVQMGVWKASHLEGRRLSATVSTPVQRAEAMQQTSQGTVAPVNAKPISIPRQQSITSNRPPGTPGRPVKPPTKMEDFATSFLTFFSQSQWEEMELFFAPKVDLLGKMVDRRTLVYHNTEFVRSMRSFHRETPRCGIKEIDEQTGNFIIQADTRESSPEGSSDLFRHYRREFFVEKTPSGYQVTAIKRETIPSKDAGSP